MLAAMTQQPAWMLSTAPGENGRSEAGDLASAIKAVADHYEIKYLDQKTVDHINLCQVLAAVYGGRLLAIRAMNKAARAPAKVATPPRTPTPSPVKLGPDQVNGARAPEGPITEMGRKIFEGTIAGVGSVEFPPDHPLRSGKPN